MHLEAVPSMKQVAFSLFAAATVTTVIDARPRAQVALPRSRQDSPLHLAAADGDCTSLRRLLADGNPVDLCTVLGETPLHEAALAGHYEAAQLLISCGAKVEVGNREGDQPLHLAAAHSPELIRVLLDAGASSTATNAFGDTPLHSAAWAGNVPGLEVMLNRGADLHARSKSGETALDLAACRGQDDAMRYLSRLGESGMHVPVSSCPRAAGGESSERRPPPAELDARWQQRALEMPPVASGLLVHADPPSQVAQPDALLLEGETCNTLSKYRFARQGMAKPESQAVWRCLQALDAEACAALRNVLDEYGSVVINSVDNLPTRAVGLDEEDLTDILGPDVVAQLFELPSRFLRASSNDGEGEAIAEAQLELVGAFCRRYSSDTEDNDQPWISFHFDNAEVTVNVALTADKCHSGGRLLALYDGGVQAISREEGEATVHSSSLLHGVSRTTQGVRYSLILFFASGEALEP